MPCFVSSILIMYLKSFHLLICQKGFVNKRKTLDGM